MTANFLLHAFTTLGWYPGVVVLDLVRGARILDLLAYVKHNGTNFLQEKALEATKQKEEKRSKPKPEEHEGMPQHQHRSPEKRRGDRNPECHKEHQKDVA
jgi:hypothetical protein